ncbi:MAG: acetyl-CoA carboxylase biotin carboxyl carrier protein [Rhodospirillales bacterium]
MSDTRKQKVDEALVRQLTKLLEETGLSEIEYGRDGWHVRVVKGGNPRPQGTSASAPAAAEPASPGAAPALDPADTITSPMVGVVFTSPDPDSPPFVNPGDEVTEGQTLLLIEAMKVFNPITAPKAGRVAKILVANGAPVEFGEPLLILE